MKRLFVASILIIFSQGVYADTTPSPAGARAYIINPQAGSEVTSPFKVQFGLEGMGIAPAGIVKENTGHHHIIIDGELPDLSQPIPSTESSIHFGGGQTEVMLELPPGEHTLQLILGDANHFPHAPPVMSDPITITVK